METPSSIAAMVVEHFEEGCLNSYSLCLRALELMLNERPTAVQTSLVEAGLPKVFLEKAAEAAASGDLERAISLRSRAAAYVGEEGVVSLLEEFRIFIGNRLPDPEVAPTRSTGFATV